MLGTPIPKVLKRLSLLDVNALEAGILLLTDLPLVVDDIIAVVWWSVDFFVESPIVDISSLWIEIVWYKILK